MNDRRFLLGCSLPRMNTRRFLLAAGLLAVSALAGAPAARACKYCWSAENAEAADYARQAMQEASAPKPADGAFPLDGTINQFQPAAQSATLAAPPTASAVVTSGADLRAARAAAANPPPAPKIVPQATATLAPRPSNHIADAGLLGLATVGGVFCWRTRRKTGLAR